jgi:SAM-dependent methyltransferase
VTIAVERLSSHKRPVPWLQYPHQARFAFAAEYVKGKEVLDCACGEAASSELFASAGASGIYAVDLDVETLARARRRLGEAKVRFVVGDATHLPLPDDSIDVCVSLETIEHIERDRDYLSEMVRLVRPDGCFICSTPNRTLTNPGRQLADSPWNPYHVREYTSQEFVQLLSDYWEEVQVFGQSPKPAGLAGLARFLGRHVPGHLAVRMLQLLKLPKLLYDNPQNYRCERITNDKIAYEALLALCRRPIKR